METKCGSKRMVLKEDGGLIIDQVQSNGPKLLFGNTLLPLCLLGIERIPLLSLSKTHGFPQQSHNQHTL